MKKKRLSLKFVIFIIVFLSVFFCLYYSSNKIMEDIGENSYSSLISSASYYAIEKVIDTGYGYDKLVNISRDNEGQISMVVTDSYRVNQLSSIAASNAYSYLNRETAKGVDVPLGAFSGIRLISGFGTPVKMKLISVSSVKCQMVSKFEQAGINQTRHSLYLEIVSSVCIVTKFKNKNISDEISILVYDNLIVGKVPSVFVNSVIIGKGEQQAI